MARKKLSEISAKKLLTGFLGLPYNGLEYDCQTDNASKIEDFFKDGKIYVVKVDEGVKKRFKQGLVLLDLETPSEIKEAIDSLQKKGYRYFIVEENIPHNQEAERYISLQRTRLGTVCWYSKKGGVDVEAHQEEVTKLLIKDEEDIRKIAEDLGINPEFLGKIIEAYDVFYFSYLEINPMVVIEDLVFLLDVAGEVDSAAEFFAEAWDTSDFREHGIGSKTEEEKNIMKLSEKSSSSLKLDVLNPDGAIFMLLSGGGVSVALADEVKNLGKGKLLANYGEYSGNPTEEETYIYTKNLLSLLLKSSAPKKVLVIAGGVANFTDVRITFRGIIRALDEVKKDLVKQKVKIFVRRGGPHQEEGLRKMREFLDKEDLFGSVNDQKQVLTEVVHQSIDYIK